ncbi:diaminopimelate epimerase [Taibaiella sp. KBW10]|uniref:diaminopimelate epimerase n=1 Tax=Taibaiella sp. KBW10 TaxID=2153357 RepID=UPI000F5A77FB|nr:diaminopimelate epimerase [Taibaiella sp. KBW10]RQO31157.1 diaminopimelate epimerase [Taibaiella sp. KBW10]
MTLHFYKYQGAGNDFVILDNRNQTYALTRAQINFLCDRRFGIGADGLMLLEQADGYDFKMVYYNADGNESSMCGNGGRCITAFARQIGIGETEHFFIAVDGAHKAFIKADGQVSLQMQDIDHIEFGAAETILNTGSPHYVSFQQDIDQINVYAEGKRIRNQERFQPKGINVNFVAVVPEGLTIRTYERGVEDETLACGTGVTAAAIASVCGQTGHFEVAVAAKGGKLQVSFDKTDKTTVRNVWLTGPAKMVFEGNITI